MYVFRPMKYISRTTKCLELESRLFGHTLYLVYVSYHHTWYHILPGLLFNVICQDRLQVVGIRHRYII